MRNRTKEELKQLRKKLGLSVKDCCEMTGTNKSTWEKWETPSSHQQPQPLAHAWLEALIEIEKLRSHLSVLSDEFVRISIKMMEGK